MTLIPLTHLVLLACATTQPATAAFPDSWIGTWRGPCTLTPAGATDPARRFTMELHVARTDDPAKYTWTIVYVDGDKRQERPYELVVVNLDPGKFQIDEGNSIVIDARLIDGVLHSAFTVSDSLITASYRMDGQRLVVELVTISAHRPTTTGGDDVPQVSVHSIRGVQRAVLERH